MAEKAITYAYILATRLKKASFLTNKLSINSTPNTNGYGGWSTCFYTSTSLGDRYTIQCNHNHRTPVTRQFSIAATAESIELREVEIHGHGK